MDKVTPLEKESLLAQAKAGDNAPPMTVSALSAALKRAIEQEFGHIRLRGEISGFKRHSSGHCYFTLKDNDAVINAVMWKGTHSRLAFLPEDGLEVVASGKISIYPGRSNYQIIVEGLELAGEGALLALLEKTKARLAAEGLFAPARKRPLPFLPTRIGVVTSPTGAVIRDILHRLSDRCPSHVLLWPVAVQGQGAAEQVAAAVTGFAALPSEQRPDVIIVARGGGSVEDLWAFNEEVLVRAIAACPIPLISAVGHETDTSLCDFAADVRAPTPTAAAELAVPVRADLLALLGELKARAMRANQRGLALGQERLAAIAKRLPSPAHYLGAQVQRLDDMHERAKRGLAHRLTHAQSELHKAGAALRPALLQRLLGQNQEALRVRAQRLNLGLLHRQYGQAQERLAAQTRLLHSLHPDLPLKRGYARVEAKDGRLISTSASARKARDFTLVFADGKLAASAAWEQPKLL